MQEALPSWDIRPLEFTMVGLTLDNDLFARWDGNELAIPKQRGQCK